MKKDINWICAECGLERFGKSPEIATWHIDKCDVCGEEVEVTEPRDFRRKNE